MPQAAAVRADGCKMDPSDEHAPGSAGTPVTPPPSAHRWDAVHLTIVALAVVIVVGIGVWGFQRIRGPEASAKFCAGVGLMGGPAAPSPEEALAGYLAQVPQRGSATDYERSDELGRSDTVTVFRPIEPSTDRTMGIVASKHGSTWIVDGGCA